MGATTWDVVYVKLYCASLLFWDLLVSLPSRLRAVFLAKIHRDLPFPATSKERTVINHLRFHATALSKESRHRAEFEATQDRLKHSVQYQKAVLLAPKRCTTPLLPLQTIPSQESDDDDMVDIKAGSHLSDEPRCLSEVSSPSLSLNTPLSTSNPFYAASPLGFHRESLHSHPGRAGALSPPMFADDRLDYLAFVDHDSINPFYQESIDKTLVRSPRRQFCVCKTPCSDFVSASPAPQKPSAAASDSVRVHPPPDFKFDSRRRRHSVDSIPSVKTPIQHVVLNDPLLSGLDLVLPSSSLNPWRQSLRQLRLRPLNSRMGHYADFSEPTSRFRQSNIYDTWMSSWTFQPFIRGPVRAALPDLVASQSSPHAFKLSSRSPPSSKLQHRAPDISADKSNTRRRARARAPSRNTRVISGMNKLQNLRDLLLMLDQTVASPSTSKLSGSIKSRKEPRWEELDPIYKIDSEVAGRAF